MDVTDRIQQIVAPSVEAMGYEIVRVQVSGTQRPTLQVMAERKDNAAITVEDCADISRAVSPCWMSRIRFLRLYAGSQLAGDRPAVDPAEGF